AVEGTLSATQTVATFTDPGGAESLSAYAAVIDWGDNSASAGTISGPNGSGVFTVTGSHTYATPGTNTITVTVSHVSSWSTVGGMPTGRETLGTATGTDGRIYVIGGRDELLSFTNTVNVYNPNTNSWASAAPMPTARQNFGTATGTDGRIYV